MSEVRPDLSREAAKAQLTANAKLEAQKSKREFKTKVYSAEPTPEPAVTKTPEISEKEKKLNELAKTIREQGAGILSGRMPALWSSSSFTGPKLIMGNENPGIGITEGGVFSMGREAATSSDVRAMRDNFSGEETSDLIKSVPREQKEVFGLSPDKIIGGYILTTSNNNDSFKNLQLEVFNKFKDDRPYNRTVINLIVPIRAATELYDLVTGDPSLAPKVFTAFYPNTITVGSAPSPETSPTKISLPDINQLFIRNLDSTSPQTLHRTTPQEPTKWSSIELPKKLN